VKLGDSGRLVARWHYVGITIPLRYHE